MVVRRHSTVRIVSSVIVTLLLVAMTAGLLYVFLKAADAAAGADEKTRADLGRLAWLGMALLGVSAVLLFGSLARTLRFCLRKQAPSKPTPYVDAWAEAGRRIKLPDDEEESEQDPDAETPDE